MVRNISVGRYGYFRNRTDRTTYTITDMNTSMIPAAKSFMLSHAVGVGIPMVSGPVGNGKVIR